LALLGRFDALAAEADKARLANSRSSLLAAVEKYTEASTVADLIGGAWGAGRRANTDELLADCLRRLNDMPAAARAACSSLRAARASEDVSMLVKALLVFGEVAQKSPGEMAQAEKESREQERLSGSLYHGGLDLSQEGRISLPTTHAALSRLGVAYYEAAVATCVAAQAASGGRGSFADGSVNSLKAEAHARGSLATGLVDLGEELQRSLELLRQAVALLRRAVRKATPGDEAMDAKMGLASWLHNLGNLLTNIGQGTMQRQFPNLMAEAEACLCEALELSKESDHVCLMQAVLTNQPSQHVLPARPGGGADRGRDAPLAAQYALRTDGEGARHDLHDLSRASRVSRAARRRRRRGRRWRRRSRG